MQRIFCRTLALFAGTPLVGLINIFSIRRVYYAFLWREIKKSCLDQKLIVAKVACLKKLEFIGQKITEF